MRHLRKTKYFGRDTSARKALIRNLVDAIVEHGRIETTVEKAKELRRHVERAITMGRKGSLNAIRVLLSRYPNKKTVLKLVNDIAPRFKDRAGGYTRIIKTGRRPGDKADMALIEFVDYDYKANLKKSEKAPETKKESAKSEVKEKKVAEKKQPKERKVTKKKVAKKA